MKQLFGNNLSVTRRTVLAIGAASPVTALFQLARANFVGGSILTTSIYNEGTLPKGVRSRIIQEANGLDVHILDAGYPSETT